MRHQENTLPILISGGGIAGLMSAILLARQGFKVKVFEKRTRSEFFNSDTGRSVNFTLSTRGLSILSSVGLSASAIKLAVPLNGRKIHHHNNRINNHPYGINENEKLHAIKRLDLLNILFKSASTFSEIEIYFNATVINTDNMKNVAQIICEDVTSQLQYHLLIVSDGVFSKLRKTLAAQFESNTSNSHSDWQYKEFVIPVSNSKLDFNSLHLWPGGDSFICAIPNIDGSFVSNLISKRTSTHSFAQFQSKESYVKFLNKNYPSLLALAQEAPELLLSSKTNDIITTQLSRWHYPRNIIVIGDAAHAISPFLGQGMNAALEDAQQLVSLISAKMSISEAITEFEKKRKPDVDALAKLSLIHLDSLKQNLGDNWSASKGLAELSLNKYFGKMFQPIYSRVAHTTSPYRLALAQDGFLLKSMKALVIFPVQLSYFLINKFDIFNGGRI